MWQAESPGASAKSSYSPPLRRQSSPGGFQSRPQPRPQPSPIGRYVFGWSVVSHRLLVLYLGEEFDAQWAQLYAELTGIGALTMTDTWQSYSKARGDATPLNSARSSWGLAR